MSFPEDIQMTLDEFCASLVDKYLLCKDTCCSESTIRTYYARLTIELAITEATDFGRYEMNGKYHDDSHYHNFQKSDLLEARNYLLRLAPRSRECKSKDFLTVHTLVQGCTWGIVSNLARLFWYDTSLRIASSYEIDKEPEHVFIHAGTEKGAQALDLDLRAVTHEKPYLPKHTFVQISAAFERLKPDQIESLLCIYHKEISAFLGLPEE